MDLKKIQALRVIADYESFSKAATHLSVSQSLLSKYVTELESELGVRLLHRNGRGAQLTPEGVRLVDYGRRIDALVMEAAAELRDMREMPAGTVVLGISSAIGATLTVPVVAAVRQLHPGIRLQVLEGTSAYVHEWLNTGRLDVAVVFDRSSDVSSHESLVEEELLLASPPGQAPRGGRTSGADLARLPFVLTRAGSKLRSVIDAYTHRLGYLMQPVAEIDALTGLLGAVEAGLAHTILPYGALRASLAQGRIVASRIESPALSRHIHLAVSTERVPTRAVRAVTAVVKQQVAALDAQGVWRPSDEMLEHRG